jgi:hypothetical protein
MSKKRSFSSLFSVFLKLMGDSREDGLYCFCRFMTSDWKYVFKRSPNFSSLLVVYSSYSHRFVQYQPQFKVTMHLWYKRLQTCNFFCVLDPYAIFDGYEIFTSQTALILLDCLKDTYDINKQLAFNLLVACPASIHPFQVWCQVLFLRWDLLLKSLFRCETRALSIGSPDTLYDLHIWHIWS